MTDNVVESVDLPSPRFVILEDSGAGLVFAAQRILLLQKTPEGAEAIAGRFETAGSPSPPFPGSNCACYPFMFREGVY
jgi:hypothetical protein